VSREVGELAELFQWLPADAAVQRISANPLRRRVEEEMTDVLAYLVRLADVLDIDLMDGAGKKLETQPSASRDRASREAPGDT